ncbi:hypothetical protein Pyn_37618 [Prunus yedoensis var. nudiflora]|uniref:PWWP domain-containing protein n=1 Tax=Prunus yedoensis var. nudiflora TaxID=2094558 RepID=A0A314YW05_PRUYE|nr:hypothetical protein Pyn_37618 [Prunus yedoensis var. nudiflora]
MQSKAKAKRQLSLGDLVLAKVKGFPYWPAKAFGFVCSLNGTEHSEDFKYYGYLALRSVYMMIV